MCGIWLYFSKIFGTQKYDDKFMSFMKFKGRGPENSDFKILDQYSTIIGFHRLALNGIVKSSANQPFMYDTDEKVDYVMCNGEIYNYKELAQKYNIQLSSGSDCEIIYPLYLQIGADAMIKELDGEFAFIICEINKKTKEVKLTIGRDQCGIRPLFVSYSKDDICLSSELKGIPFLKDDNYKVHQFPPRHYLELSSSDSFESLNFVKYLDFSEIKPTIFNFEEAKKLVRKEFIDAVRSRMLCDREFGCLLSGGLDSSLVSAVASEICILRGKKLKTFCIGITPDSPDCIFAQKVADHIGSEHTTIIIPEEEWLKAIENIVQVIESYDITSVRASTGQWLVSNWIAKNTDIKAVILGDGSDEVFFSYLYSHLCPSFEDFSQETLNLVNNIHFFDVLRSDRGVSSNGLEARVPFLRSQFLKTIFSIAVELRMPTGEFKGVEKYLLREAFRGTNLLPDEVLFRRKEAFSDGVSTTKRSWFSILQENINNMYSDADLVEKSAKYTHNKPPTKEALYYREIFEKHFGPREEVANVIPYFWMPKWCDVKDPSAREIKSVYDKE
jgi:asparagine synthase (glutamine-hydrolysing)